MRNTLEVALDQALQRASLTEDGRRRSFYPPGGQASVAPNSAGAGNSAPAQIRSEMYAIEAKGGRESEPGNDAGSDAPAFLKTGDKLKIISRSEGSLVHEPHFPKGSSKSKPFEEESCVPMPPTFRGLLAGGQKVLPSDDLDAPSSR